MYLEYTFKDELLLNVSKETLQKISFELNNRFEDLELTTDDIKAAWIDWIDSAANDGTAISPYITIESVFN